MLRPASSVASVDDTSFERLRRPPADPEFRWTCLRVRVVVPGHRQRYRLHRDSLYVFLDRDDVEPTNNSSERDLRPSVIHRKVIGGFRSAWGAEASAIRTSILATGRKQGHNLFEAFLAIAGPSPLRAAPVHA